MHQFHGNLSTYTRVSAWKIKQIDCRCTDKTKTDRETNGIHKFFSTFLGSVKNSLLSICACRCYILNIKHGVTSSRPMQN